MAAPILLRHASRAMAMRPHSRPPVSASTPPFQSREIRPFDQSSSLPDIRCASAPMQTTIIMAQRILAFTGWPRWSSRIAAMTNSENGMM